MKILITGYYGAGNFGDDIMLEAFCKSMKVANPKVDIHILKMFNKKLQIELDKSIKVINFYLVKRLREFLFKKLIKKYDLILWVGGTCFTDQDGDGFYNYMKLSKDCGVKIGYIGVGVGKLTLKERIDKAKYLMDNASIITLRDEKSYNYVLENTKDKSKVHLTEDLAYLFVDKINLNNSSNNLRRIVVSWRNLINYKSENEERVLINKLVDFIRTIIKENIQSEIILLPLDDRRDLEQHKAIYDELVQYETEYVKVSYKDNLTPREKISEILQSHINISARLHGIFVSEIANIKTIGLSYSIKIDEFMKSIGKVEDFIDIQDISLEKLEQLYRNDKKEVDSNLIKEKVCESKNNIKILSEFIGEW